MDIKIDAAAEEVKRLYQRGERERANRLAMDLSFFFLQQNPEAIRVEIYQKLFEPLTKGYWTQYQPYDFEIVDYELSEFSPNMPLVRGPKVSPSDISSGNYCVVMGAAQFFGRFHRNSINMMIKRDLGLSVLNLSVGGAGPNLFLNNPAIIDVARKSRFVILQVLSGRSVGSEEYPGERMTSYFGRSDSPRRDRLEILKEIWEGDKFKAMDLVRKWSKNYVNAYIFLIEKINRPVVLVWVSDRSVDSWDERILQRGPAFGRFPHLVSKAMIDTIAEKCHAFIEAPLERGLPFSVQSRLTGAPAPYFLAEGPPGAFAMENKYYSSQTAIEDACISMMPILSGLREGQVP